jgi:hypothetical protein
LNDAFSRTGRWCQPPITAARCAGPGERPRTRPCSSGCARSTVRRGIEGRGHGVSQRTERRFYERAVAVDRPRVVITQGLPPAPYGKIATTPQPPVVSASGMTGSLSPDIMNVSRRCCGRNGMLGRPSPHVQVVERRLAVEEAGSPLGFGLGLRELGGCRRPAVQRPGGGRGTRHEGSRAAPGSSEPHGPVQRRSGRVRRLLRGGCLG